jgi:selenocysteine lyase/cysteine desulfurase
MGNTQFEAFAELERSVQAALETYSNVHRGSGHNSNELPWRAIPGAALIRLQVDMEGFLDLNELERLLVDYNQAGSHGRKRIQLVAVSGASNVLGVFNDLAEIGRIVHRYGARLLVDAAQTEIQRQMDAFTHRAARRVYSEN